MLIGNEQYETQEIIGSLCMTCNFIIIKKRYLQSLEYMFRENCLL